MAELMAECKGRLGREDWKERRINLLNKVRIIYQSAMTLL
tara:strand:+ start:117 stop:236 length:120 start_codon:yes stop_codon:yes gene_type:complete